MKEIHIEMSEAILGQVDAMARELHQSRSWIVEEAIRRFLDYEDWFRREVEMGLQEVGRGEITDEEAVRTVFKKWRLNADPAGGDTRR
jgi:predicted transcriptional regulator